MVPLRTRTTTKSKVPCFISFMLHNFLLRFPAPEEGLPLAMSAAPVLKSIFIQTFSINFVPQSTISVKIMAVGKLETKKN